MRPCQTTSPANFQVDVGDVDSAFAECDLIFEEEFSIQRHAAVPLETRGLVAELDEGRRTPHHVGTD